MESPEHGENDNKSTLETWGIRATAIYLILFFGGIPVAALFGVIELSPLTLNELGDFFAGAFGPLAIFWVVLGFFQQGKELRNSVETLKLQAKELANSVEQQRELVSVSRDAISFEKTEKLAAEEKRLSGLKPRFEYIIAASGKSGTLRYTYRFALRNHGGDAFQVKWSYNYLGDVVFFQDQPAIKNGGEWSNSRVELPSQIKIEDTIRITLKCKDREGNEIEEKVDLEPPQQENNWTEPFRSSQA